MLTRKNPIRCNNGEEKDLTAGRSSFRFRRQEHLKGRKEIRDVFDKGRQITCRGAKLFLLKNDLPYNRICFTFSKLSKRKQLSNRKQFLWNAVARNYAKRLGREAYRLMKDRIACGYDFILLVYPGLQSILDRMEQLESIFHKAGLLK